MIRPRAAVLLAALALLAAVAVEGGTPANPMHPLIRPVDAGGRPVLGSGRPMDAQASCGACHDVAYIRANSRHWDARAKVDCLACHMSGGSLPRAAAAFDAQGRLKRGWTTLQDPPSDACLRCHGLGGTGTAALTLPDAFLDPGSFQGHHPFHFTRDAGTVFSAQTPAESGLNLHDKGSLNAAWDVHAARLLQCSSCHGAPNGPGRNGAALADGPLRRDPRREDLAQFLRQPDHRLALQDCRQCHDASKVHTSLPYAERHLDRLACQACHVPELHAPVLMEEDRSVALRDGRPRQVWRNMAGDGPPSTRLVTPFRPWLMPVGGDRQERLAPVNLVTERAWVDATGRELPWAVVRKAWGGHAPEFGADPADAQTLDAIAQGLRTLGVSSPQVQVRTRVQPIVHGVQPGAQALRRCADCHSPGGRLDGWPQLSVGPGPAPILVDAQGASTGALGTVVSDARGSRLRRPPLPPRLSLPGQGWKALSTRVGFGLFLLTALAVLGHALFRAATAARRRHPASVAARRTYLYGVYERLWHWLMAASTLLLIYSGFSIHFADGGPWLGFAAAVSIHNALAAVLLINAGLSLFYHLATRRITQFLPQRQTLWQDMGAQARYYLDGIFAGAPHPAAKTARRKLNALQQVAYMGLLNVLFPFQVLSGILLWMAGHWPGLLEPAGGLAVLTPLHDFGSWLLLSFTVGHVYLSTTGHSLTSNLRAMVDGYDLADEEDPR